VREERGRADRGGGTEGGREEGADEQGGGRGGEKSIPAFLFARQEQRIKDCRRD
jgi:hypothetical protein